MKLLIYLAIFFFSFVVGKTFLAHAPQNKTLSENGFFGLRKYLSEDGSQSIAFNLVDPETAPEEIRPLVKQGYQVMLETTKYASEYAGDQLNCTNCHFAAGNTLGGKNNGISLVGVTQKYPRQLENGQKLTLPERINLCFERSLNGKPMPEDHSLMKALLVYFQWISQGTESLKEIPWLGLKQLKSSHQPNLTHGAAVYARRCSECHGLNGEGQPRKEGLGTPPLWGSKAFNDAAGMNKLPTLAAFIYWNMPYDSIGVTEEEAIDVAGFIIAQPRPQFVRP